MSDIPKPDQFGSHRHRLDIPRNENNDAHDNLHDHDEHDTQLLVEPLGEVTEQLPHIDDDRPLDHDGPHGLGRGAASRQFGGVLNVPTAIWIGLVLVAVGFGAIFYTWGKVAGLLNVALQMPYVISGGLTGLSLVIAGATIVDVAARSQDGHERRQQLTQITCALTELRAFLESEPAVVDGDTISRSSGDGTGRSAGEAPE